ncbi:MAG: chloride channel protein, partial [Cyanobacteria bacterium J06641_5]
RLSQSLNRTLPMYSAGFDLNFAITAVPESVQTSFNGRDLPFLILLGILAGLLGAAFNRGVLESLKFYRRLHWSMAQRIALAGAISGMLVAILPPFYRNYAGLRELLLTEIDDWQTTAVALVSQFLLTIVAYGSGAPGGLFAPALLLGASLGELLGIVKVGLVGTGVAYPYALVGMGAFFTAVVRAPVTAIVIVFELTADFNLVLPLMIVSVVTYAIAESIFSGSLYQHLLAINGIHLQDDANDTFLAQLTAADIMQPKVETLSPGLSLDEVRQTFLKKPHRGFPVVENGTLLGLITQVDVARLAARPGWIPLREIVTPRPVSVAPSATAREALFLLNRYHISHLPVADTEGHLLGIVTRTDIIRTEARLRFEGGETLTRYAADIEPVAIDASYVVYQTRSPRVGKGRILVALSNPKTAALLLLFAGGIARRRHAELECLQIAIVPRHQQPSETWVDLVASREMLAAAEALGQTGEVPVHTQIRTAHDAIETLLEAIADRQISLLVLGWRVDGGAPIPGTNIAANVLRQIPCDVVLVKPGKFLASLARRPSTRWLIPFEGRGSHLSHLQRSLQLLPALSRWTPQLEVWLVQVFLPEDEEPELTPLEDAAAKLRDRLPANSQILTVPARANSTVEAVVRLANGEGCDVIVLGTTREGLLQQALHGNTAAAIARQVDATTILVRGALE